MTPKAIRADLSIFSGETPKFLFTARDDNDATVDITGAAITFTVRVTDANGQLKISRSGTGVTIHNQGSEKGVFDVTLVKADTVKLSGIFYYEVGAILAGVDLTTTYGTFTILKSGVR